MTLSGVRVEVLVPAVLRTDCGGAARLSFVLSSPATLGDLLAEVAGAHPRLERRVRDEQGAIRRYVNVYVNGEEARSRAGVATPLHDGTQVQIVPSVAGG
ncbi:ubiquitin-like small modifier protein 1 [Actinopolymorpha alba]|uniref:ubiquitin-like small modifier protein 1 n=1 Tax=Actinopolymorpha alba TaxID=533267 RepID=UPI00035DEDC5|nr:ubiquitin-like small modifier protein 1 [Actinopolymorpha alba]